MKLGSNAENPGGAIPGSDDDGGARRGDAAAPTHKARPTTNTPQSEQQRIDASHDSDTRGEHRYDDAHQTAAEQEARRDRDDLKRRLASRATRYRR